MSLSYPVQLFGVVAICGVFGRKQIAARIESEVKTVSHTVGEQIALIAQCFFVRGKFEICCFRRNPEDG